MLLGALLPDSRSRAWLRSVAAPAAVIRFCDSPADLSGAALAGAAGCIIDLEAAPSAYDPHAVAHAVRSHTPHVSIVGYCERPLVAPERVFAWVRAGVNDVVRRDDARPYAVRAQLAAAVARGEAAAVMAKLQDQTPAALHNVVACALAGVHAHGTPADLARALGMPERTLRARLERARGPTPRELVQWARLLVAVERLVHTRCPVERVADALGYASAPAFYNALRRYTGASGPPGRRAGRASTSGSGRRSTAPPVARRPRSSRHRRDSPIDAPSSTSRRRPSLDTPRPRPGVGTWPPGGPAPH